MAPDRPLLAAQNVARLKAPEVPKDLLDEGQPLHVRLRHTARDLDDPAVFQPVTGDILDDARLAERHRDHLPLDFLRRARTEMLVAALHVEPATSFSSP